MTIQLPFDQSIFQQQNKCLENLSTQNSYKTFKKIFYIFRIENSWSYFIVVHVHREAVIYVTGLKCVALVAFYILNFEKMQRKHIYTTVAA